MRLESINYSQFNGQPREWSVSQLRLNDINLIVGKNAVGKSKTLAIVNALSLLLSKNSKLGYGEGSFDVHFDDGGTGIDYSLEYHDNKVSREVFKEGGREARLERGTGGIGRIWLEKAQITTDFQTPEDEVAVVARRDSIQHPYLQALNDWANRVLFYRFGSPLGKDHIAISGGEPVVSPLDNRDDNAVYRIYQAAVQQFGKSFEDQVREDMNRIGYDIEEISAQELIGIQVTLAGLNGESGPNIRPHGLTVKERDLHFRTEQQDISQGMFRALSLLIQIDYALQSNGPSLILIDDIGEGLDYERSCELIKVVVEKVTRYNTQLVLTTNDRFVMNAIPLEKWTVLQRVGRDLKVFNYHNAKRTFDDFKFSGLNNFDFFAYDYLSDQYDEGDISAETSGVC